MSQSTEEPTPDWYIPHTVVPPFSDAPSRFAGRLDDYRVGFGGQSLADYVDAERWPYCEPCECWHPADRHGALLWPVPQPIGYPMHNGIQYAIYGPSEGRYLITNSRLISPLALGDDNGGP